MSGPEYRGGDELAGALPADPLPLVRAWLDQAFDRLAEHNPGAMTLASVDARGRPSARMVICRGFDAEDGWLVFYTDRTSHKAAMLDASPRAACVFYWEPLDRQLRVEGPVIRSPDSESDAYFERRPVGAQLAAWTSDQSQPLDSRDTLMRRYAELRARFGVPDDESSGGPLPRPPRWGGYRVWIERVEFWVGRRHRLHDRALYERELQPASAGFRGGAWRVSRLQP